MEIFAEQSIPNDFQDNKKKRIIILKVIRYVCVAAVIVLAFMMGFIRIAPETSNTENVAIDWTFVGLQFLFYLMFMLPFIATFILIGRYLKNASVEFDYILTGSIFRIVKVFQRKKRKLFVEINLTAINVVGRVTSENYDRLSAEKSTKKLIAFNAVENEEDIIYFYYSLEGQNYLLHMTLNDEMINAVKKTVSRISVFDKSMTEIPGKDKKRPAQSIVLGK